MPRGARSPQVKDLWIGVHMLPCVTGRMEWKKAKKLLEWPGPSSCLCTVPLVLVETLGPSRTPPLPFLSHCTFYSTLGHIGFCDFCSAPDHADWLSKPNFKWHWWGRRRKGSVVYFLNPSILKRHYIWKYLLSYVSGNFTALCCVLIIL